ncbi:MAG: hypothetical protein P8R42_28480 [Candidatus Binatia bacterium]|nr:hypothetical protein [Candidatus Binatia bacterium]
MNWKLCSAVSTALVLGSIISAHAALDAVWKQNELTIGYQGLTTSYSCEGLKDKVESLLVYFGAREDGMKVSAYGCAGGPYRPVPAVNLKLKFETLIPAEPGAADVVAAKWVERDLSPQRKVQQKAPQHITRGDCEVIEQFVAKVLPSFSHETLQNLTTCIPHRLGGTIPNLREKVLVPEDTAPPPA